jgi:hypothetical protein
MKTYKLTYVTLENKGYENKFYIDGEYHMTQTDTFEHAKQTAIELDKEIHNEREDGFLTACGIYH